jgi:hypothetical protein
MTDKKRIYVLQGREKCGKTPTLKILFEELKKKYPNSIESDFFPNGKDIKVLMKIKGLLVGIESEGDYYEDWRLPKSLNDFKDAGCIIIFCAAKTGTRAKSVGYINSYSPEYQIEFIPQTIEEDVSQQYQVDLSVAQNLISKAGL